MNKRLFSDVVTSDIEIKTGALSAVVFLHTGKYLSVYYSISMSLMSPLSPANKNRPPVSDIIVTLSVFPPMMSLS